MEMASDDLLFIPGADIAGTGGAIPQPSTTSAIIHELAVSISLVVRPVEDSPWKTNRSGSKGVRTGGPGQFTFSNGNWVLSSRSRSLLLPP